MRRQDNPYNLCHFEFADGRQCCMPATDGNFCRSHAQLHRRRAPVEADLSSELSPYFSGPDSSLDVHRALERVFQALSGNRITNRRAATFGYLGQLILLSKPGGAGSQLLSKTELSRMCDVVTTLLHMKYPPNSSRPTPRPTQPQAPQSTTAVSVPPVDPCLRRT
jgi:hypothetical protein